MSATPETSAKRRPYAPRIPLEERRTQLMDAALTIIARDGYAAVSIGSIAREAGVTRPVVYSSFDDLSDLLSTLLERQQQRAMTELTAAFAQPTSAEEASDIAATAVRRLIAEVRRDPKTWQTILLQPEGTPPAVHQRIDQQRESVVDLIAALISSDAVPAGAAKEDPQLIAHCLIAMLEYFGRQLLADPERFDTERLVQTARNVWAGLT